jgi:hypothetical protein
LVEELALKTQHFEYNTTKTRHFVVVLEYEVAVKIAILVQIIKLIFYCSFAQIQISQIKVVPILNHKLKNILQILNLQAQLV